MGTKKDAYDREYKKLNYDKIFFLARKGKRAEYQQAAKDFGISQSEMIRLAVETYILDRSLHDLPVKPVPISKPESQELSAEERRLLDEFNKLPPNIQKSIAKMIRAINAELERDKIIAGK